jgi:hypothetical protein
MRDMWEGHAEFISAPHLQGINPASACFMLCRNNSGIASVDYKSTHL